MGTLCELRFLPPPDAEPAALALALAAEVERLEQKYSRYRPDSLLSRLNAAAGKPGGTTVDEESAALLDYAATCHAHSGGLFDISSGVLRGLWNFKSNMAEAPPAARVREFLGRVGWHRVSWQRPLLRLPAGMELDLGGLVKEYAADSVARLARERGVEHGLVELGGDIAVIGPRPDGKAWTAGIRHPFEPQRALAEIPLEGGALATSGDYERFLEIGGRRYGHILSPVTGWPVEGLVSVSVAAGTCLVAGSAATIAMLKGAQGPAWLEELGLPCLWMDGEGRTGGSIATP